MRALLDVNVLIALLDPDHSSHDAAMDWFARNAQKGWASCPITQNGCIRIMCSPAYPSAFPARVVMQRLADACRQSVHEFWPDAVSLLDDNVLDPARVISYRQITDIYLLALAVAHGGAFVTFDSNIPLTALRKVGSKHLIVL